MYWTTPTITYPKHLRPPPLNATLLTSPTQYIHALTSLMSLLRPISAELLPLFRTYYSLRATMPPGPSADSDILFASDPIDTLSFVLESLYAYICILLTEMERHYVDFMELYGAREVGDVVSMLEAMGAEERRGREGLVSEWHDVLFLMDGEWVRRFRRVTDVKTEKKRAWKDGFLMRRYSGRRHWT